MKNLYAKMLLIFIMLVIAASAALASDPVALMDSENGKTVELYPDEEHKGFLYYYNDLYNYSVMVPDIFTVAVNLLNDEDKTIILESNDGKARFRVSGGYSNGKKLMAESYIGVLQSIGGVDKTSYHDVGDDYWEMNWRDGETYHKRKFLTRNDYWCDCEISYVTSKNKEAEDPFDDIADSAIKSLCFYNIVHGSDDAISLFMRQLGQKYPNAEAIKEQFGAEAKWRTQTEPNPEDPNLILNMEYPGIEISTMSWTWEDESRFYIIAADVKKAGLFDFLGIDIGSAQKDVISKFGEPQRIRGNKLIYQEESGYIDIIFIIKDDKVIEMKYLCYPD